MNDGSLLVMQIFPTAKKEDVCTGCAMDILVIHGLYIYMIISLKYFIFRGESNHLWGIQGFQRLVAQKKLRETDRASDCMLFRLCKLECTLFNAGTMQPIAGIFVLLHSFNLIDQNRKSVLFQDISSPRARGGPPWWQLGVDTSPSICPLKWLWNVSFYVGCSHVEAMAHRNSWFTY